MFDVSFSELVVIALVALIVIGPERLPKVARMAGHLWGRLQRYATTVKNDISHEMDMEEARKMQQNLQQQVAELEKEVKSAQLTLEQQVLQAKYKQAPPASSPETPASSEQPHKP